VSNFEFVPKSLLNSKDEKQKSYPRYVTELGIKYCINDGEIKQGILRKISVSGVCLECQHKLEEKGIVSLWFPVSEQPDNGSSFQIKGKVALQSSLDPPYQYQVVFDELEEEEKFILVELIADLLMNGKAYSAKRK
jgi:hypothetical protein